MTDLKFLISKLDPSCRAAAERAAKTAVLRGHDPVDVEHLLLSLIEIESAVIQSILERFAIDAAVLSRDLNECVAQKSSLNTRKTPLLSDRLIQVLQAAWAHTTECELPEIRASTLLLALIETSLPGELNQQVSPELLKLNSGLLRGELAEPMNSSKENTDRSFSGQEAAAESALTRFTIDLTAAARAGALDPVLGREAEIRQMIEVLIRRRQNNPILTGEPGVGKTAIVEGFALRIVSGDVPPLLRQVSLRTVDMGLLLAGASLKGEFEERLKKLIREVQTSTKPIILFVDEAHTIVGDRMEAANLLKPSLARGELRMIAATTYVEYRKYFEKDPALARRFQMVIVSEPSEEVAVQMLRGLVPALERHHGVRILGEAVRAAVELSHRYVTGRQLPDKAISILDMSCGRVSSAQTATPGAIEDFQHKVSILEGEIEELAGEGAAGHAVSEAMNGLFEKLGLAEMQLANLEDRCREERDLVRRVIHLRNQIESATDEPTATLSRDELVSVSAVLASVQGDEPLIPAFVDARVVSEVVSASTGIPLRRMLNSELRTILNLRTQLEQRVVGQAHALEIITKRILGSRAGLDNPQRPTGVFLLAGPSGVGKTETAMALAEILYGGTQSAVVLNMSEFQEPHSISGLKGSPPGYVGYGEGGVLTEAVRRRPYCLVLLDEMEKAHGDVMELFYQVFDKGTLEDAEGRHVNFRNTLIMVTSNAGAAVIEQLCSGASMPGTEELREAIRPELQRVFKPALLGRMVIVPYYPLSRPVQLQIVELKLGEIARRLQLQHGIELRYSASLIEEIGMRCVDAQSGARNIDHVLTETLVPEISERVLCAAANRSAITRITVNPGSGEFKYHID